jgi:hypothetical protein
MMMLMIIYVYFHDSDSSFSASSSSSCPLLSYHDGHFLFNSLNSSSFTSDTPIDLHLSGNDFSISFWLNRMDSFTPMMLFGYGTYTNNSRLTFGFSNQQTFCIYMYNNDYCTNLFPLSGYFEHITFTMQFSSKTLTIYRNSILLTQTIMSSNFLGGASILVIGCSPEFCMNGELDELRIFSRLLTNKEVNNGYTTNIYDNDALQLYLAFNTYILNTIQDLSMNSFLLRTATNATLITSTPQCTWSAITRKTDNEHFNLPTAFSFIVPARKQLNITFPSYMYVNEFTSLLLNSSAAVTIGRTVNVTLIASSGIFNVSGTSTLTFTDTSGMIPYHPFTFQAPNTGTSVTISMTINGTDSPYYYFTQTSVIIYIFPKSSYSVIFDSPLYINQATTVQVSPLVPLRNFIIPLRTTFTSTSLIPVLSRSLSPFYNGSRLTFIAPNTPQILMLNFTYTSLSNCPINSVDDGSLLLTGDDTPSYAFQSTQNINLKLSASDHSISFWSARSQVNGTQYVFQYGNSAILSRLLSISFQSNFLCWTVSGTSSLCPDPSTNVTNKWQFWTITFIANSKQVQFYRDGMIYASLISTSLFNGTSSTIIIGCGSNTNSSSRIGSCFNGYLDELRIFNFAMLSSDIYTAYSTHLFPFLGLQLWLPFNEQNANIINDASYNHAQFMRYMHFKGFNNATYVYTTSNNINLQIWNSDMTIAFWVKRSSLLGRHNILGYGSSYSFSRFFSPGFNNSNFCWMNMGADACVNNVSTLIDTWQHWSITFQRSNLSIQTYCNGIALSSSSQSVATYVNITSSLLYIGCGVNLASNGIGSCLDGYLDEVRIWSRWLNSREMMTSFLTSIWSDYQLQFYLPITQQMSDTLFDQSSNGYMLSNTVMRNTSWSYIPSTYEYLPASNGKI